MLANRLARLRIGTWNLQRGGGSRTTVERQLEVIERLSLDVLVVTEPPIELLDRDGVVASPALRHGSRGPESWVAILGKNVVPCEPTLPYQRMAVAARVESAAGRVVVYGSVLPWRAAARHAPDLALPGESSKAMFQRVLADQERGIAAIKVSYGGTPVIWAGDFNQSLDGPNVVGSRAGRLLLESTLARLEMTAWNRSAPHAADGLYSIDLICGPATVQPSLVERLDPVMNGRRLSDHAGYIVHLHEP